MSPAVVLHSPAHALLLAAGPRYRQLLQTQAHLTISDQLYHHRSIFTKLLTLFCSSGYPAHAAQLLPSLPNPDSFLYNSLIQSCSKSSLQIFSLHFYQYMLYEGFKPSSFTFTAVSKACADVSAKKNGKLIHSHVSVTGFSADCYVQTGLVVFYAKCGELVVARKVFDGMRKRSVVAWNAMISGYEQNGFADEAVSVFRMMWEEGVDPDSATFVGLLSACSQIGDLLLGQWVDGYIVEKGMGVGVALGTSLVNMYARCGHVEKAREVFERMREKNVVAWTAMIAGYGMHGYGKEAVYLFRRMRYSGISPNDITFVAVLSACAHSGMVKEGREAFFSMKNDYGIIPRVEHHVCMVDMLGRAGFLHEAMEFIRDHIPGEPGAAVWTAILGACKMHKEFDLGVDVAERLLAAEHDNPSHYVLVSNIYALSGRMDRVEKIRNVMISKRFRKQTGYSLIEINGIGHMFRMGDKSHLQTVEIYRYLEELIKRIRNVGYMPETEFVLHELEEEEREYALRFHSEKLAVAFGIMNTTDGTAIRVVKNLRICEDCHLAIKLISRVANREIIIRDKHRFHHFKAGFCSCQEFW